MITKQFFSDLSLAEKQQWINKAARHVSIESSEDFNYLIYELYDFFVEAKYNKQLNQIDSVYTLHNESHKVKKLNAKILDN